jgi:hypothetical protein
LLLGNKLETSQEIVMKLAILLLILTSSALGQVAAEKAGSDRLRIELRTSASRVAMTENLNLTVFFRSPERGMVTIWNALDWGAPAGLYLQVLDSAGREVRNSFAPFFHPLPPDENGKDALISISGGSFAGFDSDVPVKMLFPGQGRYTMKCRYSPPLPRHYFKGHTIWGKEDGAIESPAVTVEVQ